ncbi:hypothetical protein LCGC14_1995790 [marine sediment metagenome]|uniref:Uncharacterized protein n=1 Tax=marine sediment metagenome TaxID=412755 RepID=A0A0F9FSQ9_9ZZZZ
MKDDHGYWVIENSNDFIDWKIIDAQLFKSGVYRVEIVKYGSVSTFRIVFCKSKYLIIALSRQLKGG